MKKLLLVLVLLLLVGCSNPPPNIQVMPNVVQIPVASTFSFSVYRVVDVEAGVVCYLGIESISCLPLSETELDY